MAKKAQSLTTIIIIGLVIFGIYLFFIRDNISEEPYKPSCEEKYGWNCRIKCLEGEDSTDGGNLGCGDGYLCCISIGELEYLDNGRYQQTDLLCELRPEYRCQRICYDETSELWQKCINELRAGVEIIEGKQMICSPYGGELSSYDCNEVLYWG